MNFNLAQCFGICSPFDCLYCTNDNDDGDNDDDVDDGVDDDRDEYDEKLKLI